MYFLFHIGLDCITISHLFYKYMYKYIHIAMCEAIFDCTKTKYMKFFSELSVEYGKPENAQNEFTQQCMQRPKNCVCMVSEY